MKFNLKIMVVSTLLVTSISQAHVNTMEMQCAIQAIDKIGTISSTDEVFDILVEIITGKREFIVFERIIAQVGDNSLKEKLIQFFKEIKNLTGKERINSLRIIACRHLGVGATTSLTSKLLRVKSQIKEVIFHMFVDQSSI